MMTLTQIDDALSRLPINPTTDHEFNERARLAQLRGDLIAQQDDERRARERARKPEPFWVAVRVPNEVCAYYPNDGRDRGPYYATIEHGERVIRMDPAHARQLIKSDAAWAVVQNADLMKLLFPPEH